MVQNMHNIKGNRQIWGKLANRMQNMNQNNKLNWIFNESKCTPFQSLKNNKIGKNESNKCGQAF